METREQLPEVTIVSLTSFEEAEASWFMIEGMSAAGLKAVLDHADDLLRMRGSADQEFLDYQDAIRERLFATF